MATFVFQKNRTLNVGSEFCPWLVVNMCAASHPTVIRITTSVANKQYSGSNLPYATRQPHP